MKIILSPAKKMNVDSDTLSYKGLPVYLEQTEEIAAWLKEKNFEELKQLWKCNEKIAGQNMERLKNMDLYRNLTPAVLSYEGIAYQYMAPAVFEDKQLIYVQEHLRILSAFYGVLKPMDGVTPYRLEMQAKLTSFHEAFGSVNSLYEYWGDSIYRNLVSETCGHQSPLQIVNLASGEYSRSVLPYIAPPVTRVSCIFGERDGVKVKVKGTLAKMARGEMVRWMAEEQIEDIRRLREFSRLNYRFQEDLSSDMEYVFVGDGVK